MAYQVKVAFVSKEKPPEDDVCPICFGEFVLPCRADCGHWYCGSCILQVWNFSSAFEACKCPMCYSLIKTLKPDVFPHLQDDGEAKKVLKSIEKYNRLFVGGAWGLFLKSPLFLPRLFREMTDPNQVERHIHSWRILAFTLGFLYLISPLTFIPEEVNVMGFCNVSAIFIVLIIKLIGFIKRYRSAERVRRLAVLEVREAV